MSAFLAMLMLPLVMMANLLFPPNEVEPAPESTEYAEEVPGELMYFEMPPKDDPFYEDLFHEWEWTKLPQVSFKEIKENMEAKGKTGAKEWFREFGNQLVKDDFQLIFLNYPRVAFVYKEDTGDFKGITDEGVLHLGFAYNKKDNLFYATKNPWMRAVGFNKFYDWLGDDFLGAFDLITRRVRFTYNDLDYQVQIWKGKYFFDLCMGAELGFYTKPQSRKTEHYDCYPLDQMMPMTLKLYNDYYTYFDLPAEEHWWAVMMSLRGFRTDPHQATMESSVDFSKDPALGDAFFAALQEQCPDFTITKDGNVVWFKWQATAAIEEKPEW